MGYFEMSRAAQKILSRCVPQGAKDALRRTAEFIKRHDIEAEPVKGRSPADARAAAITENLVNVGLAGASTVMWASLEATSTMAPWALGVAAVLGANYLVHSIDGKRNKSKKSDALNAGRCMKALILAIPYCGAPVVLVLDAIDAAAHVFTGPTPGIEKSAARKSRKPIEQQSQPAGKTDQIPQKA